MLLPYRRVLDHSIGMLEDQKLPYYPTYHHFKKEMKLLKEFIQDMEFRRFIRQSTSFTAPTLFVSKKNTLDLCFCIDYMVLNKITIKNRYLVLSIDTLLD